MVAKKLSDEFEALKEGIESVGRHLTSLSKEALNEGTTGTKELGDNVAQHLQEELSLLRKSVTDMTENFKGRAIAVDESVHEKPYLYLAAAAGVGFLLGKLQRRG